jgi:hypothetical protein
MATLYSLSLTFRVPLFDQKATWNEFTPLNYAVFHMALFYFPFIFRRLLSLPFCREVHSVLKEMFSPWKIILFLLVGDFFHPYYCLYPRKICFLYFSFFINHFFLSFCLFPFLYILFCSFFYISLIFWPVL